MRVTDGGLLFSASDLVNFIGCRHSTVLDRRHLDRPTTPAEDDDHARLLQDKGLEHERVYLQRLRDAGLRVVEVPDGPSLAERHALTLAAMRAGADVVYQAVLLDGPWHGYADFLRKAAGRSGLGRHGYEAVDAKLARTAAPGHVLQLAVYSRLLARAEVGGGGGAEEGGGAAPEAVARADRRGACPGGILSPGPVPVRCSISKTHEPGGWWQATPHARWG